MSGTSLQITLGGSSASFDVTILDYQHYQLCYNGSVMTLYDDCAAVDTMPFDPFPEFLETDLFYLLAGPTGTPFSVSSFFSSNNYYHWCWNMLCTRDQLHNSTFYLVEDQALSSPT